MLVKAKLNTIEVLIPRALIGSILVMLVIVSVLEIGTGLHTPWWFHLVNVLKQCDDSKEEFKNLRIQQFIKDFNLPIKQCYHIVWSVEKKGGVNPNVAKTKEIQCFYQKAQCVVVKNWHLIKRKKLQLFKKYLRQSLIFMLNSPAWDKFNFCFSRVFC